MDTISLILLAVVVGMALIACFLAIVLIAKRSSTPTTTTPAGGATTPPVWKKVTDGLRSMFSVQTLIVMSVFASFEFALWQTQWFPHLFEGAGLWHIPYYGALIFLTNLVSEKTTGDRKTALMRTMFVIFAISGIAHLVSKESIDKFVARWNTPPATEMTRVPVAPERRVARVPTDPCDNVYKPYIVYPKPSVITYETGCFVGVNVISEEPVILIGDNGQESEPIYADSPDKALNFRIVRWRTLPGQVAHVQARLFRN